MQKTTLSTAMAMAWCVLAFASAPAEAIPADNSAPILRLESGGPNSLVTALAFNPEGTILYEGGWDKVIRAWSWNSAQRRFLLDEPATYRVPIGPGLSGVINAIAVSPDGKWLAAAGWGLVRGSSDFRHPGWKVPAAGVKTREMQWDEGVIYLFDTHTRAVRTLRGHTGPVLTMAFAPQYPGKPPVLVSASYEWDEKNGQYTGGVRVWNADQPRELARVGLPRTTTRPGLAAWHSGPAFEQIRVAIAWGDDSDALRLWDLQSNSPRKIPDGQFNHTIGASSDGKLLLTGSLDSLSLWDVRGGGPVANQRRRLALPPGDAPNAITLFSSKGDARLDRAAVVIKPAEAGANVDLRIVDLDRFQFLDGAGLALWPDPDKTPSIVAQGGHLAVAGNANDEIHTFAVRDLRSGKDSRQALRSVGRPVASVAFVKNGEQLGILVGQSKKPAPGDQPAPPADGDVIFNPPQRRLTGEIAPWQLALPERNGWNVELSSAANPVDNQTGRAVLTVGNGQDASRRIVLPAGRVVTDFALLPARPPLGAPLLAVATHEQGQPLLEVYDVASGAVVRELTGHLERVHSVAFSADGTFLVSGGGDRTICVWNLADLDQVLGARGALPGVAFAQRGAELVVTDVEADSPYRAQLQTADTVLGWMTDAGQQPLPALVELYRQLSRRKPGETIALRIRRASQTPKTITVKVGQGTDERKPLVTLFIAGDEGQEHPEWIAWSPLGPYDSSGAAADRLLGWHFNPSARTHPTRFALAGEYQTLRREGLVEHLLRERDLPAEVAKPVDRPKISIWLKQPNYESQLAGGATPLRLVAEQGALRVKLAGLTADQISAVTWKIGAGQTRRMEPLSRQEWLSQLTGLPVERRHVLQLEITTNEVEPQTFREEVVLEFQPLSPLIEQSSPAPERSVSQDAALRFRARVTSRNPRDGRLTIRVIHSAGETKREETYAGDGKYDIDWPIQLEPGDNTVAVVATNTGAPADAQAAEQTVLARVIAYHPASVAPPRLSVEAVLPLSGTRQAFSSSHVEALLIEQSALPVEGRITSQAPLTSAEWIIDDGATRQPVKGFTANGAMELKIDEQISLKPGVQQVRLVTTAQGSLPTEASIKVEFRPSLPHVVLTSPTHGANLFEGVDAAKVQVSARLEAASDALPYQAVVILNGQALPGAPTIDPAGESLSSEIDLVAGENRIQVQLANAWGAKKTSDTVRVQYRRPPQIVAVMEPRSVDAPLTSARFEVESPNGLELTGLRVNDLDFPLSSATVMQQDPRRTRWKVTLDDVPLTVGVNQLKPAARNRDGWSVVTMPIQVTVMLPPPPKAEIEILRPSSDQSVETRAQEVQFAIRSASPITRAMLLNGQDVVSEIDVASQKRQPSAKPDQEWYLLTGAVKVDLAPRDNRLQIVAVNGGGRNEAQVVVTYVRKPVDLVIDRLQSQNQPEIEFAPKLQEGGRMAFDSPLPDGNVWVHGRVRWPDQNSRAANPVSVIQVWVNGFLQSPVPVRAEPSEDLESHWKAKVRLNRARKNVISVRLPAVAHLADDRLDFVVDCGKPDERQRLHLLVVGVGEKDKTQLETLALNAVQGQRVDQDKITTPAFAKGWMYLLDDFVSPSQIGAQLERIHASIDDSAEDGSDVVMIYYRGQESVSPDGKFYLLTSHSQWDNELSSSAVCETELSDYFSSTPGAQLFLFDVARDLAAKQASEIADPAWPEHPHMAALRYAWLSNQTAPANARLLVAFDDAVPKNTKLGDIETEVSRSFERGKQQYGPALVYESRLPPALRGLVLGKPAEGPDH